MRKGRTLALLAGGLWAISACGEGPPVTRLTPHEEIRALLAEISSDRIGASLERLVGFGTRHTMSDTLSEERGIGAARRWLHSELGSYSEACGGCLRVSFQEFDDTIARHPARPVVAIVNVLAELPAREPTNRTIVVTGHYDSCVCSVDRWDAVSDAPGANDDGSGTAAVLELARAFGLHFPQGLRANVLFGAVAGEEQGLHGSHHLAQVLAAEGREIAAMITNDVVGRRRASSIP